MPRLGHSRKDRRQLASKPSNLEHSQIHVTDRTCGAQGVTRRRDLTPRKCYERLEPWLRFANLPGDAKGLHEGYIQQFASRSIGTFPAAFFQLTTAVRIVRGGESRKLIETHREIRDFLGRIPAMEPRESRPLAADEEVPFSVMLYGSRAEDGRLHFQPEPLRRAFMKALEGAETRRIRRCPICERIFYAVRETQKACSQRCNATRRVRAWRTNQAKYEYARKLRLAGVESQSETRHAKPQRGHRR